MTPRKLTRTRIGPALMVVLSLACKGTADTDPTIGNTSDAERGVVPTSPATGVRIGTATLPTGAAYLTDSTQRPLYVRVDARGACDEVCESVWPPVGATDPPAEAGVPNVLPTLIGSVLRDDGRLQVTYNGGPLHYHVESDATPPVPRARVQDRWGEWALIAPTGELLPR